MVDAWRCGSSTGLSGEWLPIGAAADALRGSVDDFALLPHASTFVEHRPNPDTLIAEVCDTTRRSSASHRSQVWKDMHKVIMAKSCPPIGHCPPERRLCHEAQLCICSGDGLLVRRFHQRLRAAFHAARGALLADRFGRLVNDGMVVIKLHHERALDIDSASEPAPGHCEDVALPMDGRSSEVWLHIAMLYRSPWRPTFGIMRRHPPSDSPGAIGLEAARSSADPTLFAWTSVWDAIAKLVDLNACVSLQWYCLLDSSRPVVRLDPSRQRIASLQIPGALLWQGRVAEQTRAKRRRPQQSGGARPRPSQPAGAVADRRPEAEVAIDSDASASPEAESAEDDIDDEPPVPPADSSSESSGEDRAEASTGALASAGVPAPVGEPGVVDESGAPAATGGEEVDADFQGEHIDAVLELLGPRPEHPAPPPMVAEPSAAASVAGGLVERRQSGARNPAQTVVILPGLRGMFRYYRATNSLVMHCAVHCESKCRLTRSLNSSAAAARQGQGRPLGLMLAWSTQCGAGCSAGEHIKAFVPTLAQRQAARQELVALAPTVQGLADLLALERPRRPGEPEEPPTIP